MSIDKDLQSKNHEVNSMQAEFCSAVGDPNRIKIIYKLSHGPINVKSLAKNIGLSASATSRHLKILRDKGLVDSHRQGQTVEYTLAAPELLDALDILLDILNNQLAHRATLVHLERYNENEQLSLDSGPGSDHPAGGHPADRVPAEEHRE